MLDEVVQGYREEYLAQYDHGEFEVVMADIRRQVVMGSLRKYKHDSVLEVGCGLSPCFVKASDYERWTIVEPIADFVEHAQKLAADTGKRNVSVIQGTLEEKIDDLQREEWDFIVVSSLLHEVAEPEAFLSALRKLCAPETVVHINVPNVYSFHRFLGVEAGIAKDLFEKSQMEKRFGRQTRFDKETLLRMLMRNGFVVQDFGTYFIKPFPHDFMEVLLKSGKLTKQIIIGLLKMTKYFPELGCEMYANVSIAARQGAESE